MSATKKDRTVFGEKEPYVVGFGPIEATLKIVALCDLIAFRKLIDTAIDRRQKIDRKALERAQDDYRRREEEFWVAQEAKQAKPRTKAKGKKRLQVVAA